MNWRDSNQLGASARFQGEDLNCSSIRFGEQEEPNPPTSEISPPPKIAGVSKTQRRFLENSLSNLQMSLSMSGAKDKMHEFMASKALTGHQPDQNSLSNTSSFDNMTMKISTNTTTVQTPQFTNLHYSSPKNHNSSNMPANESKPAKQTKKNAFAQHYVNQEIYLNVNTIQELPNFENPQQQQPVFGKNSEDQPSIQSLGSNQPYFGAATSLQRSRPEPIVVRPPKMAKNSIKDLRSAKTPQARLGSKDAKMTLRDYLYLQRLSSKKDGKPSEVDSRQRQQLESPLTAPPSTLSSSPSKNKKMIASGEVKQLLREDMSNQIRTIQQSAAKAREYLESVSPTFHGQGEVMELYALSRALYKVCRANEQVLELVQNGASHR